MIISFTGQQKDFSRYNLGNYDVKRIPKLSDEQVAEINTTRKMPENYYVMTKETNYYDKNGQYYRPMAKGMSAVIYKQPVITIIKGEKNFNNADLPCYYDRLPEGFELENTICGTFMKKTGVKSALFNSCIPALYVGSGAILALLLSSLRKIRK